MVSDLSMDPFFRDYNYTSFRTRLLYNIYKYNSVTQNNTIFQTFHSNIRSISKKNERIGNKINCYCLESLQEKQWVISSAFYEQRAKC